MPASNTPNPNPKGKAKAKPKARDTRSLDSNNELNNEISPSSSGLAGADDQYNEDECEYEYEYDEQSTQTRAQRRLRIPLRQAWQSYLLTAVIAFLTILLGLILVFLIIADSYAAPAIRMLHRFEEGSEWEKTQVLNNVLVIGEPEGLWVDSVERRNGGLRINATVEIRLGVDTDYIMGFQDVKIHDDNWLRLAWMNMGRWGVSTLGTVTTAVDRITVKGPGNTPLITVQPTTPIPVTLCPGLQSQIQIQTQPYSSIDHCDLPLLRLSFSLHPSDNATELLGFFENSWKEGSMKAVADVSNVTVVGGPPSSGLGSSKPRWWEFAKWRRWIRVSQPSVVANIELEASPLKFPNMPPMEPGSDLPNITDLVTIESFYVATFPNPSSSSDVLLSTSFGDDSSNLNNQQHILSAYNHEFLNSIGYSQKDDGTTGDRRTIAIAAHASILHPFGALASLVDLGIGVPPIPFIISLPLYADDDDGEGEGRNKSLLSHPSTSIPVVKVFTSPSFNETHIRLPLWGSVLPLPVIVPGPEPNSSSSQQPPGYEIDPNFTKALSSFIRSYLSYEPSPILLKTLFYPSLEVAAVFPPPEQKMDLVQDVRLEGMWIKPGGFFGAVTDIRAVDKALMNMLRREEKEMRQDVVDQSADFGTSLALEVLASATVHARIVLPKGFDVELEVNRLWVDALIFDGDVPTEDEIEEEAKHVESNPNMPTMSSTGDPTLPTPFPLPNPLPPRAFARIAPKTWLNATSSLTKPEPGKRAEDHQGEDAEEEEGKSIYVTAQAVDVPLQVLPGRQADLRRFVTKVLFSSEPVVAGIKGFVAVAVKIPGLTVQKDALHQNQDLIDHTSGSARLTFSTTTPHSNPRKPESDPRIEGSELILTDLPFQGSVLIGGSRSWLG